MKIKEFIENEDGSATIKLDLTEDEKELLILNGIKHAILAGPSTNRVKELLKIW